MFTLEEFLSKMHVEEIDTLLFSGDPLEMGLPRVFGGQVLGQALNAAVRTVDLERRPHGKAIFNASISFQIVEDGLSHQIDLPSHIPGPENILPDIEHVKKLGENDPYITIERLHRTSLAFDPSIIEVRTPDLHKMLKPGQYDPEYGFWFKFSDDIGSDPITHRTLLAFISDKALMSVGMMPHLWNRNTHRMIGASLDHAMWFHSEIRVNQWIYYHIDSPRSARARDLGRGSFYTQDGELIASTAQEGLIRIVEKDPS